MLYKLLYTQNQEPIVKTDQRIWVTFSSCVQHLFENILRAREEDAALSGRLQCIFFRSLPIGISLLLPISYPYPGVLAAFKVLFELGSAPFAWCDREIFEYFAKHNPVFLGGHLTRVELLEVIGLCGFRSYIRPFLPRAIFLAHLYCKICFKLSKY